MAKFKIQQSGTVGPDKPHVLVSEETIEIASPYADIKRMADSQPSYKEFITSYFNEIIKSLDPYNKTFGPRLPRKLMKQLYKKHGVKIRRFIDIPIGQKYSAAREAYRNYQRQKQAHFMFNPELLAREKHVLDTFKNAYKKLSENPDFDGMNDEIIEPI